MPIETYTEDPCLTPEIAAANLAHDRKYGWHKTCPREYTNIARNPEYKKACPHRLLFGARDNDEVHRIIWDWHNQQNESFLTLLTPP